VNEEMMATELVMDRLKTQLSVSEKEIATLVQEVVVKKLEVNELREQIATVQTEKKEADGVKKVEVKPLQSALKVSEVKPLPSALKKVVDNIGEKRECPSPFVKKSKGIAMDEVVYEETVAEETGGPEGYEYQTLPKKRLARKAKGGPGTTAREEECKQQ
jgi:hypothetical protein